VLYINVKDNVDSISFIRKEGLFGNLAYFSEKETDYNIFYNKIPVSKGTLVFFPSTTEHYVDFNKSSHKRISLSFNVFLTGMLGTEDSLSKLDL
jgi:ectoine hydroxylase-related dioxygenase (phytanoyl-CoA dioxygenase family)